MNSLNKILLFTFVLLLISCENDDSRERVLGVVTKSEWYVYSMGFSSKFGKAYYKQKIDYTFEFDDVLYDGTFNNGPDIGVLTKGDTIIIEFPKSDLDNKKIINRYSSRRRQFPSVSNNSLEVNAFDSATYELIKKSRLPEFEVVE